LSVCEVPWLGGSGCEEWARRGEMGRMWRAFDTRKRWKRRRKMKREGVLWHVVHDFLIGMDLLFSSAFLGASCSSVRSGASESSGLSDGMIP